MIIHAIVVVALLLVAELLRRRYETFRYFKKMGIPGPKPHFLWGHFFEFRDDHNYWLKKWTKQYGDTYGAFWGDKPLLITRDLAIQKHVLISNFSNFINRADLFALEAAHPVTREMLVSLKDHKWKQVRSAVTPAFSTTKLKQMFPLILKSVKLFESNLEARCSQESFDVSPLLKRLTLDNIGRTIFGIETGCQTSGELQSPLLKAALSSVKNFLSTNIHLICSSFDIVEKSFSWFISILLGYGITKGPMDDFLNETRKIVEARRNSPRRNDFMQTLLDNADGKNDNDAPDQKTQPKPLKMTENQIVATASIMLHAGYETTSTAMAFIFCCLARHQDVQQRLREELNEMIKDQEPSYESVQSLKYMDRVIKETLRLYPPVSGFITRQAKSDANINGVKIPAGLFVYFPTREIHHDEKLWKDPLSFHPDRFLEDPVDAVAYQPFGNGPRNCIGMRAALLAIKVMLAKIVPRFEISAEGPIEVKSAAGNLLTPNGARISLKKIKA